MKVGVTGATGLVLVAAITACTSGGIAQQPSPPFASAPRIALASPSTAPSLAASPSPSAGYATFAVYDHATTGGHSVILFGVEGSSAQYIASAAFQERTNPPALSGAATDLPYVSTSKTKAYFLDGDAKLRAIGADGSVTNVRSLPGTPSVHAGFAVSPDDARIAIALIDYSAQPIREALYAEDLSGGGRVDAAIAAGQYFWPVGWHAGKIVLASGPPVSNGVVVPNQYNASAYFLVDDSAGAQPTRLGTGDCVPSGLLTPAGTACIANFGGQCLGDQVTGAIDYYMSCLRRLDWAGAETTFTVKRFEVVYVASPPTPAPEGDIYTGDLSVHSAALSTDGSVIMTDQLFIVTQPNGTVPGNQFQLGYPPAAPQVPGIGWIDAQHFSTNYVLPKNWGPGLGGEEFQRIFLVGGVDPNIISDVLYVDFGGPAISPVVGQLMGTLPGGF